MGIRGWGTVLVAKVCTLLRLSVELHTTQRVILSSVWYYLGMDSDKTNTQDKIESQDPHLQTLDQATPPITSKPSIKWQHVLLLAGFVFVIIPLIAYLLFVVALSGGFAGFVDSLKPEPKPTNVVIIEKRNTVRNEIESEFDQLEQSSGLTEQATSSHDTCYAGQNNWKVKDGYAHKCDYRVTKFYGFNGDFRQRMLNLEQSFVEQNWSSENNYSSLSRIVRDYYDKYYGKEDEEVSANFKGKYLVSDLPDVYDGYTKNRIVADVNYAERATDDLFSLEYSRESHKGNSPFYEDRQFTDVKSKFAEITQDNKYVVVISFEKQYFEN